MVSSAQRYDVFVAHLATERARLSKAKMMGVRGLPPTDQASLRRDEFQMSLVAQAARFADRKHALVDATSGARLVGLGKVISQSFAAQPRAWCGGTSQVFSGLGVVRLVGNRWR